MTASLRMILGVALITILALAAFAAPIPERAADAGWQAYERGDYASALAAYEIAAKKGDRLAQFNLGVMLLRGEGKPVDLKSGIGWLTKAADAGMVRPRGAAGRRRRRGASKGRRAAPRGVWQRAALGGGFLLRADSRRAANACLTPGRRRRRPAGARRDCGSQPTTPLSRHPRRSARRTGARHAFAAPHDLHC